MKLLAKTAVLACALISSLALAGGVDQFKSFVSSTHSAKGEFLQRQIKVVNGQTKITDQSNGTFLFARPGKFIWQYQKPFEQLLQADGDKMYMYDKDLNQVTVRALGNAISSSPAAILFGSNDLEANFTIKDVGPKDGMEFLQAVPKDKDSSFALISIGMKNGLPYEMDLRDNFGKTTIIVLQNVERNPELKAGQFKFVTPPGADVYTPQ